MIFEAKDNKRWKKAKIIFFSTAVAAAVLIAMTVFSIYTNTNLPGNRTFVKTRGNYIADSLQKIKQMETNTSSTPQPAQNPANTPKGTDGRHTRRRYGRHFRYFPAKKNMFEGNPDAFLKTAFVTTSDDISVEDMEKNIHSLDMVMPDYFSLVPGKVEINEFVRNDIQNFLKTNHVMIVPRLANTDAAGDWQGKEFIDLVSDAKSRTELEGLILRTLQKYNLRAINLDIEEISSYDTTHYTDFINELSNLLHQNNMHLTVDVPVNDASFNYEEIGKAVDLMFVMDYDEHYESGKAGPIAGREWFNGAMETIAKTVPKNKLIGVTAQYAYDWNIDKGGEADVLSYDDTMLLAADTKADMQTDLDSVNTMFLYKDSGNKTHAVWLTDGVSMWNEMQELYKLGVKGTGMWRLGSEDPSIWNIYGKDTSKMDPNIMAKTDLLYPVQEDGTGEIMKVATAPKSGKRVITPGDNNQIDYADYDTLPTGYTVQKYGKVDPKQVVLTFDDGPDPVYTPQVMAVLKKYKVPATFFVVGDQAMHYPALVQEEVKNGFLVGNHTYYHPQVASIPRDRMELELNTTQRLIEGLVNHKTMLFRSPYNTDTDTQDLNQLSCLNVANELGYVEVGADVDSADYDKPGVDKIVSNVEEGLQTTGSNIIVMHDAGGTDRKQTVAALDKLIPDLESKGYKFVNLDTLLNKPVSKLMPALSVPESVLVFSDQAISWISVYGWAFIQILFYITTIISIFRIVFLGAFVIRSGKKGNRYEAVKNFTPFVSVLIPAYNEELVIEKTIRGILECGYPNYEIIVIDDGSTDSTAEIAARVSRENPKVRLLTKENGGKFSALNYGFTQAKADYVVTIDADTIILADTIQNLVLPFSDESVDAVCGNVQVGNVTNILTGFQTVEYITTQNYDRRAFDTLNCISVVPGATGAWKKSKVLEVGGYSDETLTEDADLTLCMLEHGARIVYMPNAKSVTEAPQTVKTLFKQRFRWSFGTMQTMWKHRKSFFKGTLGKVALPNMFIFQVIFPILSPIGDLVFLISIFRGDMMAILSGYVLFLLMDLAGSLIAFTLEKSPLKYLGLVFIQRFFYRQFMYVITFKSLGAVLKGRRHGWNKLKRTNSVNAPITGKLKEDGAQ